jgi:tetratricopeptide (TPR) repeat protein
MLRHYWILGTAVATSIALVAGCGSAPGRKRAPKDQTAAAAVKREREDERSVQARAEAHAHYANGILREMNSDQKGALEEFCQAALLDPGEESLVLEVSRKLLQAKQPERALEIVKRATAQPGASGELYARLGLVYAQLGKQEQAVAANREAIKKAPGSLSGYQNLFLSYLHEKQSREALGVLDDAARQPGTGAEFLIGLSELYMTLGAQAPAEKDASKAKALAALNRAAKQGRFTPMLRLKLADGLNLLGESDKAAVLYLEVLKQPPELPMVEERVRALLTNIYLRASDRKRATEQLQAMLRDDPTNPQVHYYLGRLALEDKKPAEAADHLGKALLVSPELETAYYFLALAQIELNQGSEALATLEKARRKFPQSFAMEFYTGVAYGRQKSYAEALKHFTAAEVIAKATDASQLNEGFYFQLGATCERSGDYEQAEKYFEKSLQLVPDFAEALNYLGYMWAEHGVKLDKAREMIEKALKLEPKNAAYLDSMAWVLYKLNQPTDALPYALKAVELTEQPDATVFDHVADIYAALKQTEKAREFWRKALALEPNEEIKKKLEASGGK